jgi:hypothetical protein
VSPIPLSAAALIACAALLACAHPAAAATGTRVVSAARAAGSSPEVSSNWSGYAVTAPDVEGGTGTATEESFSDVVGTWVQPKATCKAGNTTASAFWVGLGGFSDDAPALEQVGTEADCTAAGKPSYGAWFEIVPAGSVDVKLKIRPGDTVSAAVLVNGPQVTFSLRDVTRHTRFSRKITPPGALDLSSAEWIAEAPSECTASGRCQVLSLTNFGTVSFTKASTTADAHDGTISDPAWAPNPLELVSGDGPFPGMPGSGAVPAELSPDGTSFSVSWRDNVQLPPTG